MTSSMPAHVEPFVVDRPFLFYIADQATGAILFQGRLLLGRREAQNRRQRLVVVEAGRRLLDAAEEREAGLKAFTARWRESAASLPGVRR